MVKIFLLSQAENNGWDTYDSAVVTANTEDEAQVMHPGGGIYDPNNWLDKTTWCDPKDVDVIYIGETDEPAGRVICASFNAG